MDVNLLTVLFICGINTVILLVILSRLGKPNPNQSEQSHGVLIDTCALIDARILELAKTGFMTGKLMIPDFVIAELQQLADGRDGLKRQRARVGLDLVRELQKSPNVTVEIVRNQSSDLEVDDRLIELAKKRDVALYTTDYNLNKVAKIEGVTVLNVNELSNMLKPMHLPGETAEIKIVQKGQDKSQGIGYLDDGTMVVVAKAGNMMNRKVKVEFDKHLQTSAGKMMFAKILNK